MEKQRQHFDKWTFLLYFIIGVIVYYASVNGDAVFDDKSFLFDSLRFTEAPSFFSFWDSHSKYYRSWPLSFSLLWLVFKSVGTNLVVYKVINIFLHIINSFLVYKFFKNYVTRYAVWVGLIFLVHPMQVESVSWIFQFKTLLSLTFFLCGTLLFKRYISRDHWHYIIGAFILFALSLLSKITAIFFPMILMAICLLNLEKVNKNKVKISIFLGASLLLCFNRGQDTLHGVNIEYSEVVERENLNETSGVDLILWDDGTDDGLLSAEDRSLSFKNITSNISFYIGHFIWQNYNSLVYPKWIHHSLTSVITKLSAIIFIMLLMLTSLYKKESRKIIFISGCMFACLILPVSGIEYVPYMKFSPVADHWAYGGIIGLAGLLISLVEFHPNTRFIIAPILLIFTVKTFLYNKTFNNQEENIENALRYNPKEGSLLLALMESYREKGKVEKVMDVFSRLKAIDYTYQDSSIYDYLRKYYMQKNDSESQMRIIRSSFHKAYGSTDLNGMKKSIKQMNENNSSDRLNRFYENIYRVESDLGPITNFELFVYR